MVKYENEDRCWGKHAVAADGRMCEGCAWLVKWGYSQRHVDRRTERVIFRAHPCERSSVVQKRVTVDQAPDTSVKKPKHNAHGRFKITSDVLTDVTTNQQRQMLPRLTKRRPMTLTTKRPRCLMKLRKS